MNRVGWAVLIVACVVVLFALMAGATLLGGWGYGPWGMMGPWIMGPWMMGGMVFVWIIPAIFFVLVVVGVVWIATMVVRGNISGISTLTCPSCRRNVQTDWKNCPYCGTALRS
jgi:hypothetical protein